MVINTIKSVANSRTFVAEVDAQDPYTAADKALDDETIEADPDVAYGRRCHYPRGPGDHRWRNLDHKLSHTWCAVLRSASHDSARAVDSFCWLAVPH
jgi:hypothetical protein